MYTRIEVGSSPALSWYVTEKLNVVEGVPEFGDAFAFVRFPLSGQATAATGTASQGSSAAASARLAAIPAVRPLLRRRAARSNDVSPR
jgi:hypothetical protein